MRKLWQDHFETKEAFLAWAAGFFDGEGSVIVGSQKCGKYQGYSLYAGIHQLVHLPLEIIASEFGGVVRTVSPKRGVGYKIVRPIGAWRVTGVNALLFLRAIEPFSINKKDEIKLALQYPLGKRGAQVGHKGLLPTAPEVNAERLRIRDALVAVRASKKPPEIMGPCDV